MSEPKQYTGIIRALPVDRNLAGDRVERMELLRRIIRSFIEINLNPDERYWLLALPSKPKIEVLHCYLIYGGRVRWRANIAGFEGAGEQEFMDGRKFFARAWAVLTAPIIRAPQVIEMRGFRGFRYTEGLW